MLKLPKEIRSISHIIIRKLAILISLVTILIGTGGYLFLIQTTESSIRDQLIRYISERGVRENSLFAGAGNFLQNFSDEYISRHIRITDAEAVDWFEEHIEPNNVDGSFRSKGELYFGKSGALGQIDSSVSVMLGSDTEITPQTLKSLALGYDMINQYGRIWRDPFLNLYFAGPEKTSVDYWPGTAWGLTVDNSYDWRTEEWFELTTKKNNPERQQKWTGVIYDTENKNWMVSGVLPLDVDGKQVGMVGTDLTLDDLIYRTLNETLPGSYNIIMQADGRLIAHPFKKEKIIENEGTYYAQQSGDDLLQNIYTEIDSLSDSEFPVFMEILTADIFITVTKIETPDWYFILVYPKELLREQVLKSVLFIVLFCIIAWFVMYVALWIMLKRSIVQPIIQLTKAIRVSELSGIESEIIEPNCVNRNDEFGVLSRAMIKQQQNLRKSYMALQNEVTIRKDAQERMKHQERMRQAMISNISDVICIIDEHCIIRYNSPNIKILFGWDPETLIGKPGGATVHPDDQQRMKKAFNTVLEKEYKQLTIEYNFKCKDGSFVPVELTAVNMTNDDYINGVLLNFHDISEHRKSEQKIAASLSEKEVLLKEIHHRVKNNLSVINGLLNLQANYIETVDDAKEAFQESQNRILSMSMIHEQLYTSETLSKISIQEYLEKITSNAESVYNFHKGVRSILNIEDVYLDINRAVPFGIIVNEILTNTYKHAFVGRSEGLITISFNEIEPNILRLVIEDDGLGFPENFDIGSATTLGMTLISSLTDQIDGEISINPDKTPGSSIVIYFPWRFS